MIMRYEAIRQDDPVLRERSKELARMNHARAALSVWHKDYNTERPYFRLGWQMPAEFAQIFTPKRG